MNDAIRRLRVAANRPIDGSSLALFRICFGLIMFWEVLRYADHGWIAKYYIETEFRFKYWPFDFVEPWPGDGMYWHFAVLGLATLSVMVGFRYQIAAFVTFLGLAFIFLLDQGRYLNHFYLMVLVSFLMIFLPVDRVGSLDPERQDGPKTVPAWTLLLLRFQLAIPYFFGGVAKINTDWLRGEPLTTWLSKHDDFPLLGSLLTNPEVTVMMSYGGLALDLIGPFLLLFRRTRLPIFIVMVLFHLMNSGLFQIGIFPWMMMAGTLIFFPPDWPRRMWRDLRAENRRAWLGVLTGAGIGLALGNHIPSSTSAMHGVVMALVSGFIGYQIAAWPQANTPFSETSAEPKPNKDADAETDTETDADADSDTKSEPEAKATPELKPLPLVPTVLLAVWMSIQVLVPLRHFLYPSNVHWTEEGHLFSWHMKLRQKRGKIKFLVTNTQTQKTWTFDHRTVLTKKQASRMKGRPDMIVQFAHYLARRLEAEHGAPFEIRVKARARLNDRETATLIDPDKDLTTVSRPWIPPVDWIYPYPGPIKQDASK